MFERIARTRDDGDGTGARLEEGGLLRPVGLADATAVQRVLKKKETAGKKESATSTREGAARRQREQQEQESASAAKATRNQSPKLSR